MSASVNSLLRCRNVPGNAYRSYFDRLSLRICDVCSAHVGSSFPTLRKFSTVSGLTSKDTSSKAATYKGIRFPKGPEKADSSAWAALLDPIIDLSLDSSEHKAVFEAKGQAISYVISNARRKANVDILAHIGVVEQRWKAFLWLVNCLVQKPRPSAFFRDHVVKTSSKWPSDMMLDEITASSKAPKSLFTPVEDAAFAMADPSVSLERLTAEPLGPFQSNSVRETRSALGQLWRTLGNLILAAAAPEHHVTGRVMAVVLRVLAKLHQRGYIPDKTYIEPYSTGLSSSQQPQILNSLSREVAAFAKDTKPFTEVPHSMTFAAPIEPDLWLEFVLWCCVHGGWSSEGADILADLRRSKGADRWRVISWRTSFTSHDAAENDILASDLHFDQAELNLTSQESTFKDESPNPLAISSEVVAAIIDGLLSTLDVESQVEGIIREKYGKIDTLKKFLGQDRMSLGLSTWDEVVARFVELPHRNIEDNPTIIESILGLTENLDNRAYDENTISKSASKSKALSYVFDGSAASIGLQHRMLLAHIKAKDVGGALHMLDKLWETHGFQHGITSGKLPEHRSPQDLSSHELVGDDTSRLQHDYSTPENKKAPYLYLEIPSPILAALLDLLTTSNASEMGKSIVYSNGANAPLIRPELYGDQSLAPALIRFAAETRDSSLLRKVAEAQTSQTISGQTLVALCENRLRVGNWDGAMDVFKFMHEESLYQCDEQDLVRLVNTLVQHVGTSYERGRSSRSLDLLVKLLRGQLVSLSGIKLGVIQSVIGIITTIHRVLREACSPLLSADHFSTLQVSKESFEMLFVSAVKTFGSRTGQLLWELWCRKDLTSRQVREPDRSTKIYFPVSQQAELFSVKQQEARFFESDQTQCVSKQEKRSGPPTSPPIAPTFTGTVEPSISLLRTIVRQALTEVHQEEEKTPILEVQGRHMSTEVPNHDSTDVLSWAARMFEREFCLRKVDIEHELEGFPLPDRTQVSAQPLYGSRTLKIWKALHSSYPTWTIINESKMRQFATDKEVQHIIFDDTDTSGRHFLHCLAADFGLMSESFGEAEERQVSVFKTPNKPEVPSLTIAEAARRRRTR